LFRQVCRYLIDAPKGYMGKWVYEHKSGGTPLPCFVVHSMGTIIRAKKDYPVQAGYFRMLARVINSDFNIDLYSQMVSKYDIQWTTDLTEYLENRPKLVVFDIESQGLHWYRKENYLLSVALAFEYEGVLISRVVPTSISYFPDIELDQFDKLQLQLKELLEDPAISKSGHGVGFDCLWLWRYGIRPANVQFDTHHLAHSVDSRTGGSLKVCTKLYVPEMAGYSDVFDRHTDKSRMAEVPLEDHLLYAGGDAISTYLLTKALVKKLQYNPNQRALKTTLRARIPSYINISTELGAQGIDVDVELFDKLDQEFTEKREAFEADLLKLVPKVLLQKHIDAGLRFTRANFVSDILYSKEGYGLEVKELTDAGKPSVGADALFHYLDNPFVEKYKEYIQINKIIGTYLGVEKDDGTETGWKQFLNRETGKIYPSYSLAITDTGRSNSSDPNAQNLPNKSETALRFLEVVVPDRAAGHDILMKHDYSQLELRVAAWVAKEPNMLDAYLSGIDLHTNTAALAMGVPLDKYKLIPAADKKVFRQKAKAINFGLLYGMRPAGFQSYALLNYGLVLTLEEAEKFCHDFLNVWYPGLPDWHAKCKAEAKQFGKITSILGYEYQMPGIYSKIMKVKSKTERDSINYGVQGPASDIGTLALKLLCDDIRRANIQWMKPTMFIHDAIVTSSIESRAEEAGGIVKYYMENVPFKKYFGIEPPIPLTSDGGWGYNFRETEKNIITEAYKPSWSTL
jgi:DNA polymerase I